MFMHIYEAYLSAVEAEKVLNFLWILLKAMQQENDYF
jgi:hypothetical protein